MEYFLVNIHLTKNEKINITIKEVNNDIYLVQTGVYKEENIMKDSSKNLKYYLYYKDKDGYHIFQGISKNKNNMKKNRGFFRSFIKYIESKN